MSDSAENILNRTFATLPEVVAAHARERPGHPALIEGDRQLDYHALDRLMDRIAAALQRDGLRSGEAVAICAIPSLEYAACFMGILRAGGIVVPLAPSSTAATLKLMLRDAEARVLLLDATTAELLRPLAARLDLRRISLDGSAGGIPFEEWLAPDGSKPEDVAIKPEQAFNIIYSSGTTGTPKGIVQPHAMRWDQLQRDFYSAAAVTVVSTPLYSNTTLVSFLPTLANGGTVVLMPRFEAVEFLRLSETHRATNAMLVPVQYARIMARPDFGKYDLSSYRWKFATSAPFRPEIKADVLARWPGGLIEYYGMTEGGGSCCLVAHEFPHKVHTVGRPLPGHDMRVIGEDGGELPSGATGEIVGRSPSMMTGYHGQPEKTAETEWWSPTGLRYIRTGDIGRFDEDGFLILMDRRKDMIISGGFNIYPSDIETVLAAHPAVLEAAVAGIASERWGETPVAFAVLKPGAAATAGELRDWANAKLGKTQRLADLVVVNALPRSHIGKILKRELRETYRGPAGA